MKSIILFFSLLIAFSSYSQHPSVAETQIVSPEPIIRPKYQPPVKEYVTDSKVEKVVDKYAEKIQSAIIALADALKTPVEHVYKVLIKQQIVKSISLSITMLLLLSIGIAGIKSALSDKADWENGNFAGAGGAIIGIIALVAFLVYVATRGVEIVTGFVNPEYGALQEILMAL